MYSSLSQFKDYIGIAQSDTSQDEMLTLLLNSACEQINHLCGVDSFDQDTYEEQIDARKIYVNSFWYNIFVKNKPVSSIDEIDGETYSGVKGVDYMVGTSVASTDLRAGAALVTAAVAARGETEIGALSHIDRGYENFVEKLCGLNIDAQRISTEEQKIGAINDSRI